MKNEKTFWQYFIGQFKSPAMIFFLVMLLFFSFYMAPSNGLAIFLFVIMALFTLLGASMGEKLDEKNKEKK